MKTFLIILLAWTIRSFGQNHVQSDIVEMYKGKKFKAVFSGTKMSVHEIIRSNADTTFYKVTIGDLILITSNDSLMLKPTEIQTYYRVPKLKKPTIVSIINYDLSEQVFIGPVNLFSICIGRRTYKFRATKEKEQVWAYGDPSF